MSISVKLGNDTITNVSSIKLEDADNIGSYISFEPSSTPSYLVKMFDGVHMLNAEEVLAGDMPLYAPTKVGWTFNGWVDSSGNAITAINDDVSIYADYTWNTNSALKITGNGLSMKPQTDVFAPNGILYYSIDNGYTWIPITVNTTITNDTIYLRGTSNTFIHSAQTAYANNPLFTWSGSNIIASGNMYATLDYTQTILGNIPTMGVCSFASFFKNCRGLVSAPTLGATNLSSHCYASMFSGCTSLTIAPALDATTMSQYCYNAMFEGCTALTTITAFSASILAQGCCASMFKGCSSLTTAPALPATTLANYCYQYMFYDCTSLISAPQLNASTLSDRCYEYMFANCTFITAPALPATTLAPYCYSRMFQNCKSLTTAPQLSATYLANYCYEYMFQGCIALTVAPTLNSSNLSNYCYQYMFSGCTALASVPQLPAMILKQYCYYHMFENCTSIVDASALNIMVTASCCCQYMFYGCTSLSSIPALPALTLESSCYAYMFYNCTNIKLSTTQTGEYVNEYRIPISGTGVNSNTYGMFNNTGGTFKGTPAINTIYYTSNTVISPTVVDFVVLQPSYPGWGSRNVSYIFDFNSESPYSTGTRVDLGVGSAKYMFPLDAIIAFYSCSNGQAANSPMPTGWESQATLVYKNVTYTAGTYDNPTVITLDGSNYNISNPVDSYTQNTEPGCFKFVMASS